MTGALAKVGVRPELKALVAEASQALARLDASRLEELALSCQALNSDLNRELRSGRKTSCEASPISAGERQQLAREAGEALGEMAIFARVLEATRSNIRVMNRLRELRASRLEYSERQAAAGRLGATEGGNGND